MTRYCIPMDGVAVTFVVYHQSPNMFTTVRAQRLGYCCCCDVWRLIVVLFTFQDNVVYYLWTALIYVDSINYIV